MRQLTIRNLEDDVYDRLKARARINQRSLEAEVRLILNQSVSLDRSDIAKRAAAIRMTLTGRYKGDSTAEIRADRDRDRSR
jgi:plasmid stability protein